MTTNNTSTIATIDLSKIRAGKQLGLGRGDYVILMRDLDGEIESLGICSDAEARDAIVDDYERRMLSAGTDEEEICPVGYEIFHAWKPGAAIAVVFA